MLRSWLTTWLMMSGGAAAGGHAPGGAGRGGLARGGAGAGAVAPGDGAGGEELRRQKNGAGKGALCRA